MAKRVVAYCLSFTSLLIALGGCTNQGPRISGLDQYIKGTVASQQGDPDKAVAWLSAAIAQNPALTMARIKLGDLYRQQEKYKLSAQQYETIVKLDPYDYKNHYHLGLAYQFLNRLQDSANAYLQALKLNPRDGKTNMNLGLVYLAMGKPATAIKYLEAATVLEPALAAAHANYAVGLGVLGKLTEAETEYHKSLDLDPKQPTVLLNLGSLLIRQHKAKDAISIMVALVNEYDTPLSRKRYGDALALGGRYKSAMEQYQLALKADPRFYTALNGMANLYIARYTAGSELDESLRLAAVNSWKHSLIIHPDQPQIQQMIKQWDRSKK